MKFNLKQTWPALLLVVLAVIFLGDVWFGGRMLLLRDFFCGEESNKVYMGAVLRSGHLPLWNSIWQCGVPNAAQPYYGTFYPPNWIFIFPQVEWVIRLWWTFHLAVAAVSTYALSRHWRLSVGPALFAAISFAFSTYVVAWMEFTHGFCCMPWMPLALLFVSRIIDSAAQEPPADESATMSRVARGLLRRNAGSVTALAVVMALQILASAEYIYYSSLLVAGYGVAKWVWLRNWRAVVFSSLLLGIAGVLALGLATPQLILTLELMGQSVRVGEMDAFLGLDSAHPRHWLSLLLPYLYGRPGYPTAYWAPTIFEFASGTFYVGILPLIGAFFCWLRPKGQPGGDRRFLLWFLVATGVVGLTMAAGQYTPVYPFLHHWLPGLGHLRFPTKFYLFVVVALPLLGAFGFQALLENGDKKTPSGQRLWWIAAGCFGLFICGFLACLLNDHLLPWLMACPGKLSASQINSGLYDYAWAALFSLVGLVLFGMLAFGRGSSTWIQSGIVAVAFINLCAISRQVQPTAPSGIYTRHPEELVKVIGKDPRYRFFSNYWNTQQYLYGDPRVEIFDWARNAGGTTHILLDGVSSLTPGGMVLGRYSQFYGLLPSVPPQIQTKLSDMMALRYIADGAPFTDVLWKGASRDVQIATRTDCLPRAFVVSQWRVAEGEGPAWRTLLNESFNPRHEAVLEPLEGESVPPPPSATDVPLFAQDVQAFKDHGNSVTLEASVKNRALLVLSDTWYPGWTAWVDGVERPIFRANFLFRGGVFGTRRAPGRVCLQAGAFHRWGVDFRRDRSGLRGLGGAVAFRFADDKAPKTAGSGAELERLTPPARAAF